MEDQFYYEKNKDKILCAILINMDKNGKITDEQYNKYFNSNNSIEGEEIIKIVNFFINCFPIPRTIEEFLKKEYLINKKNGLTYSNGK